MSSHSLKKHLWNKYRKCFCNRWPTTNRNTCTAQVPQRNNEPKVEGSTAPIQ